MSDKRTTLPVKQAAASSVPAAERDAVPRPLGPAAHRHQARKRRRRPPRLDCRHYDPTEKLPTPPPDPLENNNDHDGRANLRNHDDKENRRLDDPLRRRLVELPPTTTTTSTSPDPGPIIVDEPHPTSAYPNRADLAAFRHLDRLHRLVAEILELRERNSRLFGRVRELERARAARRLEGLMAVRRRLLLADSMDDDDATMHLDKEEKAGDGVGVEDDDEEDEELVDTGFAASLLAAMLDSSTTGGRGPGGGAASTVPTTPSQEMTRNRSFRAPMLRQRSRSIGTEAGNRTEAGAAGAAGKRSSCHLHYSGGGGGGKSEKRDSVGSGSVRSGGGGCGGSAPPKVSKWTKVKAAFKWERASMGTTGVVGGGVGGTATGAAIGSSQEEVALVAHEQQQQQQQQESSRSLRLPEQQGEAATTTATTTTTPTGSLPRTTDPSEPPSPGTLSSSSSIEDVYNGNHKKMDSARSTTREIEDDTGQANRSIDSEFIITQNIQYATQHFRDGFSRRLEKGHRTPWGMMKDIIQSRRDNVRRPVARDSLRSEDGHSLSSLESSDMIHEYIFSTESSCTSGGNRLRVQITSSPELPASPAKQPSASPSSCGEPPQSPSSTEHLATRRLTPTLTITVPSSEELRGVSSPESASPPTSSSSSRLPVRQQQQQHQLQQSQQQQQRHQQHDSNNSTDERSEDPEVTTATAQPVRSRTRPGSATSALRERRRSAALLTGLERGNGGVKLQRQDSKWNKVKRAFLTSASSVPPSPSRLSSFFDETDGGAASCSASAEDLETNGGVSPTVQADIQRNYQLLHDKLSVEFYRKLAEWDRLKSAGGGATDSQQHQHHRASARATGFGAANAASSSSPRDRDSANALLLGEEQLTPEFKKKLQEWKRMKKGSGGGGGGGGLGNGGNISNPSGGTTTPEQQASRRRLTDWQIWRTPTKTEGGKAQQQQQEGDSVGKAHLSEDFLKKMEEWKKIKSSRSEEYHCVGGGGSGGRCDSSSTDMIRHRTSAADRAWKAFDETEFQPLERVIAMIEREQHRVERQRKRIIDKKQRINTISGPVDSTAGKREVLVHTSTGYYRFQGISQEFTRKLYEWEKSQGIKPESSTLRLLNPAYRNVSSAAKTSQPTFEKLHRTLNRSKSAINLLDTNLRDGISLRQSSSLSLNDITNIENEEKLRIDSKQTIGDEEISEELALDDSEPEAVIVDIEDVIEETASPIARFQPEQTPVYYVTASETTSFAIPLGTVTSNHEPSPVILAQAKEALHRARKLSHFSQLYDENTHSEYHLEFYSDNTKSISEISLSDNTDILNDENRKRLFQPSDISICETIIEEDMSSSHIGEESSSETETTNEIKIANEAGEFTEELKPNECPPVTSAAVKLIEIQTLPERMKDDRLEVVGLSESERDGEQEGFRIIHNQVNDSVKDANGEDKDIDKANTDDCMTVSDKEKNSDESRDVVITVRSNMRQKKILKTRRLTDTQVGYKWQQSTQRVDDVSPELADSLTVSAYPETPSVERIIINESTLNKIVVPTASNEQISSIAMSNDNNQQVCNNVNHSDEKESYCRRKLDKTESKSVFVKTKRIIFSPFSRRNGKDKSSSNSRKNETETSEATTKETNHTTLLSTSTDSQVSSSVDAAQATSTSTERNGLNSESSFTYEKRPPLPQSPILQRKEYRRSSPKETAPSIRMMIQRYNQKLQEDASSPASSGSGSPLWRSPISERRVRNQMERYQEEVRRAIAGSCPRNDFEKKKLEKSASAGIIQPIPARSIIKSTSVDFVRNPDFVGGSLTDSKIEPSPEPEVKLTEFVGKRKNSLQNKTPEIFSNIKQCLVQESKTITMKNESAEGRNGSSSTKSDSLERMIACRKIGMQDTISPELISKLNALSNFRCDKHDRYNSNMKNFESQVTASETSTPLRVRAQRIKKAKDDFFSRGPSCYSHEPSIETYLNNESTDSTNASLGNKSVSVGMINVDTRTFQRLSTKEKSEKSGGEVAGTFSKLASRFRRAKIKRHKDKEVKMSAVSTLCRQSLLVDIQAQEMSKSCPTSPSPQRESDERTRVKQYRDSS